MDKQFNDALALLGLKELENSYLRKQVAQLQLSLKQIAESDGQAKEAPKQVEPGVN